jgi:hypothetical protein
MSVIYAHCPVGPHSRVDSHTRCLKKACHFVPKAVKFDHYENLLQMENVWETLEMVKMVCYSGFTTSIMAMGL